MAKARSVSYKILYDGAEVGLSAKCKSISYTDNSSGVSDEITLDLEDREASWAMNAFIPEKEHDLDVTLYFNDWNREGETLEYHCGNFTLDDITYTGGSSGHKCVIKGVSIPASQSFQTCKASKLWKKVTVKQIAEEFKQKYGMSDLYYWADEPVIEKVEQDEQTDSEFLYDLCSSQGLFLKIYKKALVIFDKALYEGRGVTAKFKETDMKEWTWNSTLNGTFTGAQISYTHPKKKETLTVLVGQEPRVLTINEKADNEAEALRTAKAKVNEENEKAVTIDFTSLGNPNIVATCNIEITGMGRISGKYFVDKVTHSLSGSSGHSMTVSGYRIFERL
ncbi:MAG: phage late control D family protein [Lachnospiraceae bacterium]